jgi:hypothetical protein
MHVFSDGLCALTDDARRHWMHNPRTPKFMEAVHSACGALRRINASFCFPAHRRDGFFEDNIRATGADPLGSLGDLGWCDPDRIIAPGV